MRYSSMKFIVALSIAVTMLAAVPVANAAPAQGSRTTKTSGVREDVPAADRIAAIRRYVNRAVRRLASHTGLTIPHPTPADPTNPE